MTSLGVYGVIIAGWASNSKYAFLGSLRSAAQIVAYEIAMGFALVGVLMSAQSLNLHEIALHQAGGLHQWYLWPLFPLFVVYFIAGVAETNRAPFDVAEGETEIVAGFHVEYSGITFALFFLAEYANMILISALASVMFLGGWWAPLNVVPFTWVPPLGWLLFKMCGLLFLFLWFRATFVITSYSIHYTKLYETGERKDTTTIAHRPDHRGVACPDRSLDYQVSTGAKTGSGHGGAQYRAAAKWRLAYD